MIELKKKKTLIKEMSIFIENLFASQQGCTRLLKSDSKDFNIITNKSKLSIYQRMLKKCIKMSTKNNKQHTSLQHW